MNRKILFTFGMFLVGVFLFEIQSLAAPGYFYPKKYEVTINNVQKQDIKNIEIIYKLNYGFNYETNDEWRDWLKYTDFGYKYKNYTDEEIIPTLSEREIDCIAKLYIHSDPSSIQGYWIDSSLISINSSISKFGIYKNVNVDYEDNKIVITYLSDDSVYSIDDMYLRITKNDETVIYSNPIHTSLLMVFDENSTNEELNDAKNIEKETAYFETDFSEINNNNINIVEKIKDEDVNKIFENRITFFIIQLLLLIYLKM